MITLRDYQRECVDAMVAARARGVDSQLVVLPTGAGKTVILAQLGRLYRGSRILLLAHRRELLDQAARTFERVTGGSPLYQFRTVQSLVRKLQRGSAASDMLWDASRKPLGRGFDIIIVDEAHHAPSRSYLRVLRWLGALPDASEIELPGPSASDVILAQARKRLSDWRRAGPRPMLVGVTATPNRADNLGLEWVFERVVFRRSLDEMVRDGWLKSARTFHVNVQLDLSLIKRVRGDFESNALSKVMTRPDVVAACVRQVSEFLRWPVRDQTGRLLLRSSRPKRLLVFACSVEHALALSSAFNTEATDIGGEPVVSRVVYGNQPFGIRESNIRWFAEDAPDLRVLVNCDLLTEGYDNPSIDAVFVARPTTSHALYMQMIGRGTRLLERMTGATFDLFDVADSSRTATTLADITGLPPTYEPGNGSTVESLVAASKFFRDANSDPLLAVSIESRTYAFDNAPPSMPKQLRWFQVETDRYQLEVTWAQQLNTRVTVERDTLGGWLAWYEGVDGKLKFVASGDNVEDVFGKANGFVAARLGRSALAVSSAADSYSWRAREATAKQRGLMSRLGIDYPEQITAGEASARLDAYFKARRETESSV